MSISKTTPSFIVTSALLLATATTLQADDIHYSFGADVVEFDGHGALVSSLTYSGGPGNPGSAQGYITKKVTGGGNFHRVRLECTADEWGNGRVAVVSPWMDASSTRWRSSVTCPSHAPYADIWSTMVQARSLFWRFRCQDNESEFFSCSSFGEWF